ncbi:MAG: hypothetical protein IPM50_13155 [Acidobacteriota bacterium]|nr:MAG: hypothetical protein IPM50_13155 [Acidobacteriota bacterium]
MSDRIIHYFTIAIAAVGLAIIVFIYASAPRGLWEVVTRSQVALGVYSVDKELFDRGVAQFRAEEFPAARNSFERADPEKRDAATQFYVAYTYYREGWGRVSNDDALFAKGLEAADRALELNPDLAINDEDLKLRTPFALRAELESGLKMTIEDLNPLKLFRERK